jgi:hypothetical protein
MWMKINGDSFVRVDVFLLGQNNSDTFKVEITHFRSLLIHYKCAFTDVQENYQHQNSHQTSTSVDLSIMIMALDFSKKNVLLNSQILDWGGEGLA